MEKEKLVKLYKALYKCTDLDKVQPKSLLTGINHQKVGDQWAIAATNGKVAVRAYVPEELIPVANDEATISQDGTRQDGRFPNIDSVVPKQAPTSVMTMPIKDLTKIADTLLKLGNYTNKYKNNRVNNVLILSDAYLDAGQLKLALGVMALYTDKVKIEIRKQAPSGYSNTNTVIRADGTSTFAIMCNREPDKEFDYTIDQVKEMLSAKPEEPKKSWFEQ